MDTLNIIEGIQKYWAVPGYGQAGSLFSKCFHELVFGWTRPIYLPNLKSLALVVPEIIAIAVFRHRTSSFPQISPCSPGRLGVGGWPLRYEERRCWANCPCH